MYADLDSNARAIRTAFIREKARVFGKKKITLGKRYDRFEFWQKAAHKCQELELNPDDFVRNIFDASKNPRNIFPNMLYGKLANQAAQLKDDIPIDGVLLMEVRNNYQLLKRLTGSDDIDNYYDLVCDPFTPLLPYVRLLMFPMDPTLLEKYGNQAWEFLHCRPEHIKVLDELGFRYNEFNDYMTNGGRE